MVLQKQRVEVPLGVGVETKSQDYVGDHAHVQLNENVSLFETGAARKRAGELPVGSALTRTQRALLARKGQLAVVGYDGLRYLRDDVLTPLPGQRGVLTQAIRPIPCEAHSRKVRGDLPEIADVPHAACAMGQIVYAWASVTTPYQLTLRLETITGEILVPDAIVSFVSILPQDRVLRVVANGPRAVVWFRDDTDDVDYVPVDLDSSTFGVRATYYTGTTYAYDSLPQPGSPDHVYLLFYDAATGSYQLHRVYLPTGATSQSVTITPTTPPTLPGDARTRLHVGSDGLVWAFTGEGVLGVNWHVRTYDATLTPVLTDRSVLFAVYGLGRITDIAVAEYYGISGSSDPTQVLILAQHDRDATETPANSSASVLDAYRYTSAGTLTGGGSAPPLYTRVPNCRLAGQSFALLHATAPATRIPFFPVRYWRDVEDPHKAAFAAGLADFEFHTSMLITPHYGESGGQAIPNWNIVARYGTDLEGRGSRPLALSSTKFGLVHSATAAAEGELGGCSIYLTTFEFDPPHMPSEALDGTWFGLGHQSLWSGSELIDGATAAAPGPPVILGATGAGDQYQYKASWEWEADDGALVRSHESPASAVVLTAIGVGVVVHVEMPPAIAANHWTNKRHYVSIYRTQAGLVEPYRRVVRSNALNPSIVSIPAKVGSWQYVDTMADSELQGMVPLYTTGGRLNAEPPVPFLDYARIGDRVWAIDGQDDHRVWPSLVIEEQTAPEWSVLLALRLPSALVAVCELGGRPLVLGLDGVWTIYGDGANNAGSGDAFKAVQVSECYGALHAASVARTPLGVVFLGRRGLYLVTPDMQVSPWGLEVDDYLRGRTVRRIEHTEPDHVVRIYCTDGMILIYDLVAGAWSNWAGAAAQQLLAVQGNLYRLTPGSTGQRIWLEQRALPSPRPLVWTDVGSPSPAVGDNWLAMVRARDNTLFAVGSLAAGTGRVGRRLPGNAAWGIVGLPRPLTGVTHQATASTTQVTVVGEQGYAAHALGGTLSFTVVATGTTANLSGVASDNGQDWNRLPTIVAGFQAASSNALATQGFASGFFTFPLSGGVTARATQAVYFFGGAHRDDRASWYWVMLREDHVTWTSGYKAFGSGALWVDAPGPVVGATLLSATVAWGYLYVCGSNGLIARTASVGGTAAPTWEILSSGTLNWLSGMDSTDEGLIVAVGDSGLILWSDTGTAWTPAEVPAGVTENLICVAHDGLRRWTANGTDMQSLQSFTGLENHGTLVLATKWIKIGEPSKWGQARLWGATLLARQRGLHGLRIDVGYDYETAYAHSSTFTADQIDALVNDEQAYELRIVPSRQKCSAVRFQISELSPAQYTAGVQLISLTLDVGVRAGGAQRVPQARVR